MSLTPLKKEVDAISALLVEGDETPEALAKRVIKALDEARSTRVTYSLVLRFGGNGSVFFQSFGPYATPKQAQKAYEKHPAAGMATAMAVVPCVNDQGLGELIAKVDAPVQSRGDFREVKLDAEARRNGWDGKANSRGHYLR